MEGEDKTWSIFRGFIQADTQQCVLSRWRDLCTVTGVQSGSGFHNTYLKLKAGLNCNEARTLFRLLDRRAEQKLYDGGNVCKGLRMFVIGAGVCGLRMAIEASLLGASVTLIEMRDYILRNNVLHLWPFVIHDLKSIGAKVFYPKFCSGNREHISTRRLQVLLLKLALVVGADVHSPVSFDRLVEPSSHNPNAGWRVKVCPAGHVVEQRNYDVIIGADGNVNSLRVFKRKLFRGKVALGVTVNFVNKNSVEDNSIDEIGGIFKIFNPPFFAKMKRQGGMNLENFVYFKSDTHYFVFTISKDSLIQKGVFRKGADNSADLLASNNVDQNKLRSLAREAASIATNGALEQHAFATNHHGQPDVSLFDFTALHRSDHSCMAVERHGSKLLLAIIGDTLIEPFWPTGSGVGRGFLSVLDTAWLLRAWGLRQTPELQIIAEREGLHKILSQTTANILTKDLTKYTIDPNTRYGRELPWKALATSEVKHLYRTDALPEWSNHSANELEETEMQVDSTPLDLTAMMKDGNVTDTLLVWYREALVDYIQYTSVADLRDSWKDGRAFICIIHKYRPELINLNDDIKGSATANITKAFSLIEEVWGVSLKLDVEEVVTGKVDTLMMMAYLVQLKACLREEPKVAKSTGSKVADRKFPVAGRGSIKRRFSSKALLNHIADQPKKVRHTRMDNNDRRKQFRQAKQTGTLDRCINMQVATSRIKDWENFGVQDKSSDAKEKPPKCPSGSRCSVCGLKLKSKEVQNLDGQIFHKSCFKCSVCKKELTTSDSELTLQHDGKVTFLCGRHAKPLAPLKPKNDNTDLEEAYDENIEECIGNMSISSPNFDDEMVDNVHDWMTSGMDMVSGGSLNQVAVGEEEMSDEENIEELAKMDGESTLQRKKRTLYSLATSIQLQLGHHFQQKLAEAEHEEEKIVELARSRQNTLRKRKKDGGRSDSKTDDVLTQEFLQLQQQQQRVEKKKNDVLLKAKFIELQQRYDGLKKQMDVVQKQLFGSVEAADTVADDADTQIEDIEHEICDVERQTSHITRFFQETGETLV